MSFVSFRKLLDYLAAAGVAAALLSGCTQQSYPAARLKESLTEICRQEYGIDELDVKVAGDTIGVYLPLKKLFASDFKEAIITGKVRNLETLFEPSPEALEKVEDVLFSISRVILSTDKTLQFYVLQATDIEKTGLQLILTGYVDDIKRVRLWDISRNEYRKRVIHELRLNHAVIWHRPVHQFFEDLGTLPPAALRDKYLKEAPQADDTQDSSFLNLLFGEGEPSKAQWEVVEMKSIQVKKNEALVYAKAHPHLEKPAELGNSGEYSFLFILSLSEEEARITRVIPLPSRNNQEVLNKILLLAGLGSEKAAGWEEEFNLEEVHLGPFLSQQITRRVQALISVDERIQNTFREINLNFQYHEEPVPPHFSLDLDATLRDFNNYKKTSLVFHEDMLYLLDLASREFVEVVRGYKFGDFDYLRLNIAHEPGQLMIGRDNLELFRRRKTDLQGLLSLPRI